MSLFQTDEGRQIGDVLARLLADIPPDAYADVEQGKWPEALWGAIEESGIPLALVPEDAGGFGLPLKDGLALVQVSGEKAAPLPLAETMISNLLASQAGFEASLDPTAFVAGDAQLTRSGSEWQLTGKARHVAWGHLVSILLLADSEDGPCLVRLPAGSVQQAAHGSNLAGEPRDDLVFALNVTAPQVRPADLDADTLLQIGAGMRCLEMAGALQAVLDMTVYYVKERTQFGRPLGNFQAIQHQIAQLASETAAAKASAQIALASLAGPMDACRIAAAKIRIGEAAGLAAAIAHQVHGAMGFTREYPLHLYVRRLWSWRDEFGSETVWAERLGRHLARAGSDGLWPEITRI